MDNEDKKIWSMLFIAMLIYVISAFYAPPPTGLIQSLGVIGILFSIFIFGAMAQLLHDRKSIKEIH